MAFFRTAAIGTVFCGVLQQQDRKPPQYICFRGSNLDIEVQQKPTAINISFCSDTVVAVENVTTICELQRRLYDCCNRCYFLRRFCLVIVAGWTAAIDLYISQNFPLFFIVFPLITFSLFPLIPFFHLLQALTLSIYAAANSISVTATINSTFRSRHQLHLHFHTRILLVVDLAPSTLSPS